MKVLQGLVASSRGWERGLVLVLRAGIAERYDCAKRFPIFSRNQAFAQSATVGWLRASQVTGSFQSQSSLLLAKDTWNLSFLQRRAASRAAADDGAIQTTGLRSNGKELEYSGKQQKADVDSWALLAKKRVRGKHKLRQDEEETANSFPTPFPSNVGCNHFSRAVHMLMDTNTTHAIIMFSIVQEFGE